MAALAGTSVPWSAGVAAQPAPIMTAASQAAYVSAIPALIRPAVAKDSARQQGYGVALATSARQRSRTGGGPGVRLTPQQIARRMLARFGWRRWQFRYLNLLWSRESGWDVHASNAYSGAYGIPQAVPGAKMASAGPNWWSSARTQIRWGLRYIKVQYGSPWAAWQHELITGWY